MNAKREVYRRAHAAWQRAGMFADEAEAEARRLEALGNDAGAVWDAAQAWQAWVKANDAFRVADDACFRALRDLEDAEVRAVGDARIIGQIEAFAAQLQRRLGRLEPR